MLKRHKMHACYAQLAAVPAGRAHRFWCACEFVQTAAVQGCVGVTSEPVLLTLLPCIARAERHLLIMMTISVLYTYCTLHIAGLIVRSLPLNFPSPPFEITSSHNICLHFGIHFSATVCATVHDSRHIAADQNRPFHRIIYSGMHSDNRMG
eukprot:1488509-Pleurochrysis_carterae.AAC.1